MLILGLNAFHGDVSAALVRDGVLLAAVEEERFKRIKHFAGFPRDAIRSCLAIAGASAGDLDRIVVSRDPTAHLWRKALFALRYRPTLALVRDRSSNAAAVTRVAAMLADALAIDTHAVAAKIDGVEHHRAHLASSYFASPFDSASVCAIDGFGDFVSTSTGVGEGSSLRIDRRVFFPHSLGVVYLALTQYLGFPNYGDEYKVMGLAPYGEPSFLPQMRQLVRVDAEGGIALDLSYFTHWSGGMTMTWANGEPTLSQHWAPKLEALLGPARRAGDPIDARHHAIAASLQAAYEEWSMTVLRALYAKTRNPRLCLAGGCAMNSVANGKIRTQTPFTDVYIQPAAADNGTALGAALHAWHEGTPGGQRWHMDHAYWGPAFDDDAIGAAIETRSADLEARGCVRRVLPDEGELCDWTATRIAAADIVGWFQGRMEWGSRALGNRSIVADPRRADMRDIINTRIKLRESFRPFAPSILEDALDEYFIGAVADPFMIQVYPVRPEKRSALPAVTHVDGSGRLQTVNRDSNPRYWRLIDAFRRLTGVPVLLNTSFNENEPIVAAPAEALDCFLRTDMDVLVMGSHTLVKPPRP